MSAAAVQLHCGECGADGDHDSVHLQSCSGTDRNGNTVTLKHCGPEKRNNDHHSVRLQSCSGVDRNGTSVKLDHCFGEPVPRQHTTPQQRKND